MSILAVVERGKFYSAKAYTFKNKWKFLLPNKEGKVTWTERLHWSGGLIVFVELEKQWVRDPKSRLPFTVISNPFTLVKCNSSQDSSSTYPSDYIG